MLSRRGLGGVARLRVSSQALGSSCASFGGRCSLLVEVLHLRDVLRVEELTHEERVLAFFTVFSLCPCPVGCVQHVACVGSFGALASWALLPPIALHLLVDHEGGVLEDLHILLAAVRIVFVQHCVQILPSRRGCLHVHGVLSVAQLAGLLVLESSLGVPRQASLEVLRFLGLHFVVSLQEVGAISRTFHHLERPVGSGVEERVVLSAGGAQFGRSVGLLGLAGVDGPSGSSAHPVDDH